jgi:signal transduction histidine kinase
MGVKLNNQIVRPKDVYVIILFVQYSMLLILIFPQDAVYIAVFLIFALSMVIRWRADIRPAYMALDTVIFCIAALIEPTFLLFLFIHTLYFIYHGRLLLAVPATLISLVFLESAYKILPVQAALLGLILLAWKQESHKLYAVNDDLRQKLYRMEQTELKLLSDTQQSERLSRLSERQNLAEKLHDHLGHELTAAHLLVKVVSQLMRKGDYERSEQSLKDAETRLEGALSGLQKAVSQIEPTQDSGVQSVLDLFDQFIYPIELSTTGDFSHIPVFQQQLLFMSVQEGLTNIARHAEPEHITVTLMCTEQILKMSISNDGIKMNDEQRSGNGLRYMRKRIEAVHGSLSIQQHQGQFTLIVIIPGVYHA